MNTKAENVAAGASPADIMKYVAAAVLAAGGMVAFYLFPQWPAVVRVLAVLIGLGVALAVLASTAQGARGKEFLSESLFELRKVVWPTREEAMRITVVVLVVVVIVSLVLAGFDWVIALLVEQLLSTDSWLNNLFD
jgi:preprotein translocase subunit SecE